MSGLHSSVFEGYAETSKLLAQAKDHATFIKLYQIFSENSQWLKVNNFSQREKSSNAETVDGMFFKLLQLFRETAKTFFEFHARTLDIPPENLTVITSVKRKAYLDLSVENQTAVSFPETALAFPALSPDGTTISLRCFENFVSEAWGSRFSQYLQSYPFDSRGLFTATSRYNYYFPFYSTLRFRASLAFSQMHIRYTATTAKPEEAFDSLKSSLLFASVRYCCELIARQQFFMNRLKNFVDAVSLGLITISANRDPNASLDPSILFPGNVAVHFSPTLALPPTFLAKVFDDIFSEEPCLYDRKFER